MKSKPAIFSLTVLLLALQLGASHETYQPATDHYRIVTFGSASPKSFFVEECRARNYHGWSLVVLNSAWEVNITFNLGKDASVGSCYVGGSTNYSSTVDSHRYYDTDFYIPNNSGTYDTVEQLYVIGYVGKGRLKRPESMLNCAVCENGAQSITERLTFASTTREYKLLESSAQHNYAYMASRCTDLGDGWAPGGHRWAPAVLNDQTEADFIRQGQRGYTDIKSYWIVGSTTSQPWSLIGLTQYSTGISGPNRVIISTWGGNLDGYNATHFQMRTLFPLHGAFGILCEKALGSGWVPTVLNDEAELDFIRAAQKGLSHFRSYWIGGSTTANPGNQIEFSEYSATEGGSRHVMVETGNINGYDLDNFRLVADGTVHNVADSILCEKDVGFGGYGWRPAVLNDSVEADFIRQAQLQFGLLNRRSYFISGSTNATHDTYIDFDSYSTGDSAKGSILKLNVYPATDYEQIDFKFD